MKYWYLIPLFLIVVILFNHQGRLSSSKVSKVDLSYLSVTPYPTTSLEGDHLLEVVNQWRVKIGKKIYKKNNELCNIAEARTKEIQTDFNHDKFYNHTHDFYYEAMQENILAGDQYISYKTALDSWLQSASHSAALHKDYQYSCIKCLNNRCVQIFMNL